LTYSAFAAADNASSGVCDEKYARFVLQVKDPQTAAEKINSVAGGGSRVAA